MPFRVHHLLSNVSVKRSCHMYDDAIAVRGPPSLLFPPFLKALYSYRSCSTFKDRNNHLVGVCPFSFIKAAEFVSHCPQHVLYIYSFSFQSRLVVVPNNCNACSGHCGHQRKTLNILTIDKAQSHVLCPWQGVTLLTPLPLLKGRICERVGF